MNYKRDIPCVVMIILAIGFVVSPAFADSNIPIMSHDQREQVFNKVPNFQGSNIDYFFKLIITPTGVQLNNAIVDQKNYTALKNNVGFFTACGDFNNGLCEPPVVTTASPTINYCPVALMILKNQDGYLNKTFTVAANGTVIKDLTNYIYPSYCYTETGPNPINGNNVIPVPEFNTMTGLITAISVLSLIALSKLGRKLQ